MLAHFGGTALVVCLFVLYFFIQHWFKKNSTSWLIKIVCPFVVWAFFKCSFDVGAFVKCFFVGVILSTCLCRLAVGPIMLCLICNFDVLYLWRDSYMKFCQFWFFFIFSLNLKRSFVDIPNLDIWQYVLVMSRTRLSVNPHSIVAWMSRNSLLKADAKSEV